MMYHPSRHSSTVSPWMLRCLFWFPFAMAPVMGVEVGFEDLPLTPESSYNGSDGAGQFVSGGVTFYNQFDSISGWSGFAYSNETDITTPGFTNQYSVLAGSGADGSSNFAIGYVTQPMFGDLPRIEFPQPVRLSSVDVTNTTYAGLSMLFGDMFAEPFGGMTGNDPDFFRLTIMGLDETGGDVGEVEFYLADYQFNDNSLDYVLDTWETVDLSTIPVVSGLQFNLETTDNSGPFPNTPFYFALDELHFSVVPEPSSWLMAVLAICVGCRIVKWSRRSA